MTPTIVVVEYYETSHGYEEKHIFKAFTSTSAFEEYCVNNAIQILKGAFGTKYNDDTYTYIVNHVELISES